MVGLDDVKSAVTSNIIPIAAGAAVGVAAGGLAVAAFSGTSRKKKSRRKITHTRRGLKQDRKRKSKQPWEVAYRRRKRKAKRGRRTGRRRGKVHYAKKTGQPYILKANGQAKFIKGRRKK